MYAEIGSVPDKKDEIDWPRDKIAVIRWLQV